MTTLLAAWGYARLVRNLLAQKRKGKFMRIIIWGGLLGLVSSCSAAGGSAAGGSAASEASGAEPVIASIEQEIVNGKPACDPALDAVGGLVFHFSDPAYGEFEEFYCSATLIAPKVALTARHCVLGSYQFYPDPAFSNYVVFGQDAYAPEQEVKVTGYLTAPSGPGGLLNDGGRDMAVLYLEEAPEGIKPAKLGKFKSHMLGDTFRIAGYGQTEQFTSGTKYEGKVTARALSGDWYPLLFDNNYEAFDEWYWTDASLAEPSEEEQEVWWSSGLYTLEPGYELLAGGSPGEAVGCWGDSGGPLLKGKSANNLTVYGVSFAGEGSIATNCALGGGYAVLNPEMLDWVKSAVSAAP